MVESMNYIFIILLYRVEYTLFDVYNLKFHPKRYLRFTKFYCNVQFDKTNKCRKQCLFAEHDFLVIWKMSIKCAEIVWYTQKWFMVANKKKQTTKQKQRNSNVNDAKLTELPLISTWIVISIYIIFSKIVSRELHPLISVDSTLYSLQSTSTQCTLHYTKVRHANSEYIYLFTIHNLYG